jgi:hypothetical protein
MTYRGNNICHWSIFIPQDKPLNEREKFFDYDPSYAIKASTSNLYQVISIPKDDGTNTRKRQFKTPKKDDEDLKRSTGERKKRWNMHFSKQIVETVVPTTVTIWLPSPCLDFDPRNGKWHQVTKVSPEGIYRRMNDRKKVGLEVEGIVCVINDIYSLVNKELIRRQRSCFIKKSPTDSFPAVLLTGMVMAKDKWCYGRISTIDKRDPHEEWIREDKIYFSEPTGIDIEKINDVFIQIRGESQTDRNSGILNVNEISTKIREIVNKEETNYQVQTREKRRQICKVDSCKKIAQKSGLCRYHQVHQVPEQTKNNRPHQIQQVNHAQEPTPHVTQQTQHPATDFQQYQQLQFQQFQMTILYQMQQFQSFQQYQLQQFFPTLNSQRQSQPQEQQIEQGHQQQHQLQQQQQQQQQQPSEEQPPSQE